MQVFFIVVLVAVANARPKKEDEKKVPYSRDTAIKGDSFNQFYLPPATFPYNAPPTYNAQPSKSKSPPTYLTWPINDQNGNPIRTQIRHYR